MSEEKKEYFKNDFGCIFGFDMETPRARCIYVNLRQKARLSNKFQITLLFDANDEATKKGLLKMKAAGIDLLREAGELASDGKTKAKGAKGFKHLPLKKNDDHDNEAFHGKYYIMASAKELPALVDIDNKPLQADAFASGMIVRAVVQPRFFPANGAGISWNLGALRLVKDDGVRYYAGPDPKSLFSDDSEDAGEGEMEDPELAETEAEEAEVEETEELEEPAPKKKATTAKPAEKPAGAAKKAKKAETADDIMSIL